MSITFEIPTFRPGQRVSVTPRPIEIRCKICGLHWACLPLILPWVSRGIVIKRPYGQRPGVHCKCCGASDYMTEGTIPYRKITNGEIFEAPWTWLTPLEDESC